MQKTKTTTKLVLSILLGIFLFSCNQNKEAKSNADENGVREITVDLKASKDIDLADFADEVKYIKLETNKVGLFRAIYKLIINEEGIFIFDPISAKKVFHFSLEGEFLNTIGKVGNGPEEYVQSHDFFVDEITNTIDIVSGLPLCIFKYTASGNFVKKLEYGENRLERVQRLQNGNYFVNFSNTSIVGENQYAVLSPDFEIINDFVPLDYPIMATTAQTISNTLNNSILFTYGYGDTIYQYNNDSVQSMYPVDYASARIPNDKRIRTERGIEAINLLVDPSLNYAAYGNGLLQNQTHVFFSVLSRREDYLCCYNKQKNAITFYSNIVGKKKEVYSRAPRTIHNGNLVFSIDAVDISEQMKKEDSGTTDMQRFGVFSSFEEVQANTYADDNPILVFMKPKSDL